MTNVFTGITPSCTRDSWIRDSQGRRQDILRDQKSQMLELVSRKQRELDVVGMK